MHWKGYYINLADSLEKRKSVEDQLTIRGLSGDYARFEAIDGRKLPSSDRLTGAEIGIYQSHLELIRRAASSPCPVHIIEDDVHISKVLKPFLGELLRQDKLEFDILVTETGFAADRRKFRTFQSLMPDITKGQFEIQLVNITRAYMWNLNSYVLSPKGARKLQAIAEEELEHGPRFPIDVLIRRAARQGRISIHCTLPFLTWFKMDKAERSLASRTHNELGHIVSMLTSHSFFIERNLEGYLVPFLRNFLARNHLRSEGGVIEFARFLLNEIQRQSYANPKRPSSHQPSPFGKLTPLVSCVMVTRGDINLVRRSAKCFLNQDYPNRELLIVTDNVSPELRLFADRHEADGVRLVVAPDQLTLGDLRNYAAARAKGTILCQWDDDDLFHPSRISVSVRSLLASGSSAVFMSQWLIWWPSRQLFALSSKRLWEGSMFIWKNQIGVYPALPRSEDTIFLNALLSREKVTQIQNPSLYVYCITGQNTWDVAHFERMVANAEKKWTGAEYEAMLQELAKKMPMLHEIGSSSPASDRETRETESFGSVPVEWQKRG